MARWVGGWLLVAILVLAAARFVVRPERDAWLFIGVGRVGTVLVARYDVANTGLFAEQLTTRLAYLHDEGSPLAHRTISGPARLDDDGVHGALDLIERGTDGWSWSMGGDAFSAQARTSAEPGCPPRPGRFTAVIDVPHASGHGSDGRTAQGTAVVVRTRAVGNVSGGALYALDGEGAVGLDPLSSCPGFFILGDQAVQVETPWIPPNPERNFTLSVAGHELAVRTERGEHHEPALDHTLLPERWLAWAVGFRTPMITLKRVKVRVDGRPPWNGVLILRDHAAPG